MNLLRWNLLRYCIVELMVNNRFMIKHNLIVSIAGQNKEYIFDRYYLRYSLPI